MSPVEIHEFLPEVPEGFFWRISPSDGGPYSAALNHRYDVSLCKIIYKKWYQTKNTHYVEVSVGFCDLEEDQMKIAAEQCLRLYNEKLRKEKYLGDYYPA